MKVECIYLIENTAHINELHGEFLIKQVKHEGSDQNIEEHIALARINTETGELTYKSGLVQTFDKEGCHKDDTYFTEEQKKEVDYDKLKELMLEKTKGRDFSNNFALQMA